MISYDNKYIFIRVPRTASRAIHEILDCPFMTHHQIGEFRTYPNFNDYYKFCFVRNPWDRLVSAFHYLLAGGLLDGGNRNDLIRKQYLIDSVDGDFDLFVKTHFSGTMDEIKKKCPLDPVHFYPQNYWVCLGDSVEVDFVGKYENLLEDWKIISKKINNNNPLEKINTSKHAPYKEYYTKKSARIIGEFYSKDIELFDYAF